VGNFSGELMHERCRCGTRSWTICTGAHRARHPLPAKAWSQRTSCSPRPSRHLAASGSSQAPRCGASPCRHRGAPPAHRLSRPDMSIALDPDMPAHLRGHIGSALAAGAGPASSHAPRSERPDSGHRGLRHRDRTWAILASMSRRERPGRGLWGGLYDQGARPLRHAALTHDLVMVPVAWLGALWLRFCLLA
jgi:hypothetical protein